MLFPHLKSPGMQNKPQIRLILDTHVLLWAINGDEIISSKAKTLIMQSSQQGFIGISAISLWEISMLEAKGRIILTQPCLNWIEKCLEAPGITLCPITPEIAVQSASLPGTFHGDPADRLIVSTARIFGAPLVTRDQKILDYAKEEYIECIKA
jgi:PIN domain nuclease of toxin-antitoxin system